MVLGLSGLVAVPLGIALQSTARAERNGAASVALDRNVDWVGDQLRRDLLAGAVDSAALGSRASSHTLVLQREENGRDMQVEWTVVGSELRRRELDLTANVVVADFVLGEVASTPNPFSYVDDNRLPLSLDASVDGKCVALVGVTLRVVEAGRFEPLELAVAFRRDRSRAAC